MEQERPSFFGAGGGWVVLATAVVSLAVMWRFLTQPALAGGALAPLGSIGDLWGALGVQARIEDGGVVGASDPFHAVLAVLGSLSWWSPGFAVVVVVAVAMPLAALSAWFAAARYSTGGWGPAVVAVGWGLAPPLLAAIGRGELGAVVAHVLLPWLLIAALDARRSWSMAAVAGLLLAAVTASAPVLAPGLVILLVALIATRPAAAGRIIAAVIPAAALFAALACEQIARGTPLALLADPGVPVADTGAPRPLALLLGSPTSDYAGWHGFPATLVTALGMDGLTGVPGAVVLVVLVAPIGLLAVAAVALPGGRRAIAPLVVAAVGLLTAVGASVLHLAVTPGGDIASIWPGSGVSLYWLGMLLAAAVAIDGLRRYATIPAVVALIGVVLAAAPLVVATTTGATDLQASNGRVLPALIAAEGGAQPGLGTLDITAVGDDEYAVAVQRGAGRTEERIRTIQSTGPATGPDAATAQLVADIGSDSGADVGAALEHASIRYVLLRATDAGAPAHERAEAALAADPALTLVGPTPQGTLWQHTDSPAVATDAGPGPWGTPLGAATNVLQIVVFLVFGLLAIPTVRRSGVRAARGRDADLIEDGDEEE